ncbi:MAG: hypothetical protein ACFB14_19345 [Leptolyngbyaceae cyanobacterium]
MAIMYEVIAEETTEENIARRRKQPSRSRDNIYSTAQVQLPLAAESQSSWNSEDLPY